MTGDRSDCKAGDFRFGSKAELSGRRTDIWFGLEADVTTYQRYFSFVPEADPDLVPGRSIGHRRRSGEIDF